MDWKQNPKMLFLRMLILYKRMEEYGFECLLSKFFLTAELIRFSWKTWVVAATVGVEIIDSRRQNKNPESMNPLSMGWVGGWGRGKMRSDG